MQTLTKFCNFLSILNDIIFFSVLNKVIHINCIVLLKFIYFNYIAFKLVINFTLGLLL